MIERSFRSVYNKNLHPGNFMLYFLKEGETRGEGKNHKKHREMLALKSFENRSGMPCPRRRHGRLCARSAPHCTPPFVSALLITGKKNQQRSPTLHFRVFAESLLKAILGVHPNRPTVRRAAAVGPPARAARTAAPRSATSGAGSTSRRKGGAPLPPPHTAGARGTCTYTIMMTE